MRDEKNTMPLFSEWQYFPRWVLLIIAAAALLPFIIGSLVHKFPFRMINAGAISAVIGAAIILGCNLRTEVYSDGIRYRFIPFHLKWHFIPFTEIENIYVRQYSPLKEFGGWGIRWNLGGCKAYNARGNMGVQLELRNGKKILFGTQKPVEWQKIISEIFSHQEVLAPLS